MYGVGLADGWEALGKSIAQIRDAVFFRRLGGRLTAPNKEDLGEAYASAPEEVRKAYDWAGIGQSCSGEKRGIVLVPYTVDGRWGLTWDKSAWTNALKYFSADVSQIWPEALALANAVAKVCESQLADLPNLPTGFWQVGERLLVNCTPHPIRFRPPDGSVVEVQPSGYTLKASPAESPAGERDGAELVKTTFVASAEGDRELLDIEHLEAMPIGSIISAQAWPGRVFGLVPVEGCERKPPAERLYRCDKFTVF